jgi:hypothetical protein
MRKTYPVSIANVVAAGVEPEVGVAVLCAVLLAVVQHALEDIGDGAVVAASVAGRKHNNVPILRRSRISAPAVRVLWNIPVPFRLPLEVSGLRLVVVCGDGRYRFAGAVISVVLDWHVAVEPEEDNEYRDCSVHLVSRCLLAICKSLLEP